MSITTRLRLASIAATATAGLIILGAAGTVLQADPRLLATIATLALFLASTISPKAAAWLLAVISIIAGLYWGIPALLGAIARGIVS